MVLCAEMEFCAASCATVCNNSALSSTTRILSIVDTQQMPADARRCPQLVGEAMQGPQSFSVRNPMIQLGFTNAVSLGDTYIPANISAGSVAQCHIIWS